MQTFVTKQFRAGNSQAVRLPANMAFPPNTPLIVHREGNRIIVEPEESHLQNLSQVFANLGKCIDDNFQRPEFIETKRQ